MINFIFFNSKTLVTREIVAALKKRKDIHFINTIMPLCPPETKCEGIIRQIKQYLPAIILSINDAGYDTNNALQRSLIQSGSYIANWYHDYPFYEHEFKNRTYCNAPERIDFISEQSYVPLLQSKGFTGYFLPLATDPAFFSPKPSEGYERDIAFVGNSTLELMDVVIDDAMAHEIEQFGKLFTQLKREYYNNFTIDIRKRILKHRDTWKDLITIPEEKFIFGMEWMIGYQFRRDFIMDISQTYRDRFFVYGDPYWQHFIKDSPVSSEACYYDNLSRYYSTTKINLNINRIQIRTSFTQRPFDCKAIGAFLLTDKRENNNSVFITEGKNKEIVEFESLHHCHELIQYYLKHEEERQTIAQAGIDKILKHHTYDNRIDEILSVCRKIWKI